MPVENIRGVNIVYQVIGERGPWVALITGGRRAHNEFIPLARKLAAGGYRVMLHDRRNTGASDILLDRDEVEEITWADDLNELLGKLGAIPAFIGGSSSGARTSILFTLRHPESVRALMLLRVTGGAFAAKRLPENYYGQYIRACEQGGMAAVCATEQYQERIAANPKNRDVLMAMDPKDYLKKMTRWQELFVAGAHHPVMGVTPAEMASIKAPTIIIPGQRPDPRLGLGPHRASADSGQRTAPVADHRPGGGADPVPRLGAHEDEIARVVLSTSCGARAARWAAA